ncbi:hypothetical protein L6164_003929 [Bauhinia variegata]|uniref:Uncharacterized protein n=1 Tax=Bauhinia variegata TaxID=167791 RepID=A0ACB9Q5J1_BAUVA|nr:hypothetical protein L6164_003929 [Bauhinia variegata]
MYFLKGTSYSNKTHQRCMTANTHFQIEKWLIIRKSKRRHSYRYSTKTEIDIMTGKLNMELITSMKNQRTVILSKLKNCNGKTEVKNWGKRMARRVRSATHADKMEFGTFMADYLSILVFGLLQKHLNSITERSGSQPI